MTVPALRELQDALCRGLLARREPVGDWIVGAERFTIYANNFQVTLTRALRLTFPAVDLLVGPAFFDAAADAFIRAAPPRAACLSEYGDGFAGFLAAFPPAASLPYLADVARVEWAIHATANAPDAPSLDPGALGRIDPDSQHALRFHPHPATQLLRTASPADTILDAVLARDDAALAAIDPAAGPVHLLLVRNAAGVVAARLDATAWAFVAGLCDGVALGTALGDASSHDAADALAHCLELGAFRGVTLAPTPGRNIMMETVP